MGMTRDLFKKIRDTKGTLHEKMGSIKDRNGMDLTETEDMKKRGQEYTAAAAKSLQLCPTLVQPHRQQPTRLLCLWNYASMNTRVDCHFPLQGTFHTQGLNSSLLHLLQ